MSSSSSSSVSPNPPAGPSNQTVPTNCSSPSAGHPDDCAAPIPNPPAGQCPPGCECPPTALTGSDPSGSGGGDGSNCAGNGGFLGDGINCSAAQSQGPIQYATGAIGTPTQSRNRRSAGVVDGPSK